MAAGRKASGGMGRKISKIGKDTAFQVRLIPHASPCGTPMTSASRKPEKMRKRLMTQPAQYLSRQKRPRSSKKRTTTSDRGGIRLRMGIPSGWATCQTRRNREHAEDATEH